MVLRNFMLRVALRPKVVHSLPGRVRIHILALQRIPEEMAEHAAEIVRILTETHPHVNDIEVNLPTGNILVHYDVEQASEQQVVGFVERVLDVIRAEWAALKGKPVEELVSWARENAARLGEAG